MDRPALDQFAAVHRLDATAVDAALGLTGARPARDEWRAFAARVSHAAGLGGLGAGVLFFVAANWQAWGLLGRFALLQLGLLLCVGVALWRPPPQRVGAAALLLATLLTGGLLALFGQSYQTGADLHELFFTWALLTLPFAGAALSGAVWALWWTVLNTGLALLCGWLGTDHLFWQFIAGWGWGRPALMLLPCLANLAAAGGFLALRRTRLADAAPLRLLRYLATLGVAYGTAATLPVAGGFVADDAAANAGQDATVVLLYVALSLAIAVGTWWRRQDVFPLTLLAGSWIAISTAWLAHSMRLNDLGELFLIALWLIGSSTVAGMGLMHWWRRWRAVPSGGAHA
jgi:hypothetical protein